MENLLKRFEHYIVLALLAMMVLAIFLAAIQVAVIFAKELLEPPRFFLNAEKLQEIFGFLLMILIGLELTETIKVYLTEHVVHVEIIILVAITAVARKVIVLNVKVLDPLAVIGIAAIILALSGGYYAIKKAMNNKEV